MGRSKRVTYIVSGICILVALAMIGGSLFLVWVLRGDVRESSKQVEDYGKWLLSDKYSQLLVFPMTIPDSAQEVSYYYQYESGYTRPMCQIYLNCRLNDEDYESEINRLASLTYDSKTEGRQCVQYDDHSFQYPAYVANAGYDFCYEYALINTDERQIIYVYAMNTLEQDIKFEAEYLPDYFMEGFADFSETGLDRFTMYERYHNE